MHKGKKRSYVLIKYSIDKINNIWEQQGLTQDVYTTDIMIIKKKITILPGTEGSNL
jgi:hypothetical protein